MTEGQMREDDELKKGEPIHLFLEFEKEREKERAQFLRDNEAASWKKEHFVFAAKKGKAFWNEAMALSVQTTLDAAISELKWDEDLDGPRTAERARAKALKEAKFVQADFSGETIEHDLAGYNFPGGVNFANATLKAPNFEGAKFGIYRGFVKGEHSFEGEDLCPVNFTSSHCHKKINLEEFQAWGVAFNFSWLDFGEDDELLIKCSEKMRGNYFDIKIERASFEQGCLRIDVFAEFGCHISVLKSVFKEVRSSEIKLNSPSLDAGIALAANSIDDTKLVIGGQRQEFENLYFIDNKIEKSPIYFKINVRKSLILLNNDFKFGYVKFLNCQIDLRGGCSIVENSFSARFEISGGNISLKKRDDRLAFIDFSENSFENTLTVKNITFHSPVSFSGCKFDGALNFNNVTFSEVPDLRLTKMDCHFSLDGLKFPDGLDVGQDEEALRSVADKYQRLKELAMDAQDHEKEFEFFAGEMRVRRLVERNWGKKALNWLYDKVSDFGQSIFIPSYLLIMLWTYSALSAGYYILWTKGGLSLAQLIASFKLMGLNLVPFLASSRLGIKRSYESLFGTGVDIWVDSLLALQGGLGFVFLFLIGLALRNRFRL